MILIRTTMMSIVARHPLPASCEATPQLPIFSAVHRAPHALIFLRQFATASNLASFLWLMRRRRFDSYSTLLREAGRPSVCAYGLGQPLSPTSECEVSSFNGATMEQNGQTLEEDRAGLGLAFSAI